MKSLKNCLQNPVSSLKHLKPLLPVWWVFLVFGFPVILATVALASAGASNGKYPEFSSFSSKPLVLGTTEGEIYQSDARAQKIDKVFEKYKCPMTGTGRYFVESADKHNIPYWVVASIAFQESTCGKNTPKHRTKGESYNAWGFGVWGTNVKTFNNWEEGIETVSKYMSSNFYSRGVDDLCVIMRTYTPPSKGSWCSGVKYFADIIENFETT